jgi:hypothetical protein
MKDTSNSPFVGGIHVNKSNAVPMNGKPYTQENMESAGLSPEELELQNEERALQEKRDRIQQQKEAAEKEAKDKLFAERDKAKNAADDFRRQAMLATDPNEKKSLYGWATEADLEVVRIERGLGIFREEEPVVADHTSWFQRNRFLTALLQVVGVLVGILYFHGLFEGFGETILEDNKGLPIEQKLQPYDVTSIQKLFYEKLVVFVDLPIALVVLFLIVPFVGFYVLPFVRSRKDFYTEFYEELTSWQRAIITTAFCLGLLFFLALSHNVKP